MKTAKSIEVARIATNGSFAGVTVSTPAEAAYFASHGLDDARLAVCPSPTTAQEAAQRERREHERHRR